MRTKCPFICIAHAIELTGGRGKEECPGGYGSCMKELCQLWDGESCGLKLELVKDSLDGIVTALENLDQRLRQ